jgi:hypothetical protein
MKKLICLLAFAGLGLVAVHAQTAATPAAAPSPAIQVEAVEVPKDARTTEVKAEKKTNDKECTPAEKKKCASGHACCGGRKKSEAKKQTTVNP